MATINQAMHLLASNPQTIFLGQGVGEGGDGVATFKDFDGIPMDRRIELPVCEELQIGMGIGMAMEGHLPVLVYPRMDFLFRAADQIFNHLDLLPEMSRGQFKPKVIIRTRVGSKTPLDAGPQHTKDMSEPFRQMLRTVTVHRITAADQIMPTYRHVLECPQSAIVVEAL